MKFLLAAAIVWFALAAPTAEAGCPADALGTARVLTVDAATAPRIGRKQFPEALPLNDKAGRGIVLLHDTKVQTACILPALLRELKKRGYAIVHVMPGGGALLH